MQRSCDAEAGSERRFLNLLRGSELSRNKDGGQRDRRGRGRFLPPGDAFESHKLATCAAPSPPRGTASRMKQSSPRFVFPDRASAANADAASAFLKKLPCLHGGLRVNTQALKVCLSRLSRALKALSDAAASRKRSGAKAGKVSHWCYSVQQWIVSANETLTWMLTLGRGRRSKADGVTETFGRRRRGGMGGLRPLLGPGAESSPASPDELQVDLVTPPPPPPQPPHLPRGPPRPPSAMKTREAPLVKTLRLPTLFQQRAATTG